MQQAAFNLPDFSAIDINTIVSDLQACIEHADGTLAQLENIEHVNWQNFALPVQALQAQIEDFFSPISHLNAVANSDELREAYQQCTEILTAFSSRFGQNEKLFKQYQQLEKSLANESLTNAQSAWLSQGLRDFTLSGVALVDDKKQQFKTIKEQLAQLSISFSNNVMDATEAYQLHLQDEAALAGVPDALKKLFAEKAAAKKLEGFLIGLDIPSYQAIVTYADNEALRKKLYFAYQCKASDMGKLSMDEDCQFDNSGNMLEILQLRQKLAALLGFENYAQLSLARKMADSVTEVTGFLLSLLDNSTPAAESDLEKLIQFAKEALNIKQLQPWDVAYVSEKYRQHYYSLDEEEIRAYFPVETVLSGLFEITAELFDLQFVEQKADGYHEDAQLFIIKQNGEEVAAFYLDLFARDKKRGGAWMADCRSRWIDAENNLQLPVAFLSCNFRPAVGDKPALLSHNEVVTLFHEFGHGLHHMLTKQDVFGVSGIAGVEWDAVELPSQFLENWCWDKQSLQKLSCHVETKAPLPDELLENMLAAKNFNAGLMMLRQLEFALFDFLLHCLTALDNADQIQDLLDQVREKTALLDPPLEVRFQHGFSHIFAGGYAAGYYSYKWAEVLSADCFSAFEEAGVFDKATGQKFLQAILQAGSSKPAKQLFVDFMGREPEDKALLRHCGLTS